MPGSSGYRSNLTLKQGYLRFTSNKRLAYPQKSVHLTQKKVNSRGFLAEPSLSIPRTQLTHTTRLQYSLGLPQEPSSVGIAIEISRDFENKDILAETSEIASSNKSKVYTNRGDFARHEMQMYTRGIRYKDLRTEQSSPVSRQNQLLRLRSFRTAANSRDSL